MNPKRILMIGTMAIAFTVGLELTADKTTAQAALRPTQDISAAVPQDDFLHALGASSEQEVYEALYNGRTLADIAITNQADVSGIIALQSAELLGQLEERLKSGSLTRAQYEAQKREVTEIITHSVWGT
ncbi:hypothetical protein [Paenibacillus cremeus]|uniref:SHOCT domain-containing protein n=1 Tax=Paenibacillus cremeus TaxID=2163881 RepID=A0A559KI18_9BACL|nr:hypothetical protein [Paenibacillus cremeus]TVY11774.1 hypothetical protein FPZ49_00310 [Paenibacillus cremeus]